MSGLTVVTLVVAKGYLERLNFVGLEGLGCLVSNDVAREFHCFWVVRAVDVVEAQVDGLPLEQVFRADHLHEMAGRESVIEADPLERRGNFKQIDQLQNLQKLRTYLTEQLN